MHSQFFSGAATFQPNSSPFRPTTPAKPSTNASGIPTPTRAERHKTATEYQEYGSNSRRRLFGLYASESQNFPASDVSSPDENFHTDSFAPSQYSYQYGFGSNSGSNSDSTSLYPPAPQRRSPPPQRRSPPPQRRPSAPQRRSPVYFTQMTSNSPEMFPTMVSTPDETSQFQQYEASYAGQYLVSQPRHPDSGQLMGEHYDSYSRTPTTTFAEEPKFLVEQKQRTLSEGMEERRRWATAKQPQQEHQYDQYEHYEQYESYARHQQQQQIFLHKQVPDGEEKVSPDMTSWHTWTKEKQQHSSTSVSHSMQHASDSISFLKQHDEKPPKALIAWQRYSAANHS